MAIELKRKITIKEVVGDVQKLIQKPMMSDDGKSAKVDESGNVIRAIPEGGKLPLMRIVGQVSRSAVKATDLGEYVDLRGIFRATSLLGDGKQVNAPRCILPGVASEPIHEALALGERNGVSTVEFAYDIGAERDDTAIRGYEYYVQPLLEVQPDDPLARLTARAEGKEPPALPAPATSAPAPAAAPAAPAETRASRRAGK